MSYDVRALSEHARSHITLERLQLSLDQRDHDLDQAVLQALTGDLRLMQALADRGAGVLQEVSFERNMNERRRYRGSNLTSMRLFSERNSLEGRSKSRMKMALKTYSLKINDTLEAPSSQTGDFGVRS